MYQCLGRGTTEEGRARALKLTFTIGPITAVAGSLGAQFVLNQGIPTLPFPYDFAFLYLMGMPCRVAIALVFSRFRLAPVAEQPRPSFLEYMKESFRAFTHVRILSLLWLGYFFWYCTLNAMPNLSLYTRNALGRDPKELSGLIMALRFGFKCLGGWALGAIALKWGARAPVIVTVLLVGSAALWTWTVPGYFYLLAFGLLGAGELGGAYMPNYCLTVSEASAGARNLAVLMVATPLSGISPPVHGALTDLYGFPASFSFAIATGALSLLLVLKLPARPRD
jgi:Na+/melibiose symporter-like transporter